MEDPNGCNASLLMERTIFSRQTDLASHALRIISEDTFRSLQRNVEAGAEFPIEFVPISARASYEQFDEWRKKYFELYEYSRNESEALTMVTERVSPVALAEWGKCKALGVGANGIAAIIVQQDEETIFVKFVWNPPPGVDIGIVTNSSIVNGSSSVESAPAGKAFPLGYEFSRGSRIIMFSRIPKKRTVLSVTINDAYTEIVTVDPPPIPVTPPIPAKRVYWLDVLRTPDEKTGAAIQRISCFSDGKHEGCMIVGDLIREAAIRTSDSHLNDVADSYHTLAVDMRRCREILALQGVQEPELTRLVLLNMAARIKECDALDGPYG